MAAGHSYIMVKYIISAFKRCILIFFPVYSSDDGVLMCHNSTFHKEVFLLMANLDCLDYFAIVIKYWGLAGLALEFMLSAKGRCCCAGYCLQLQ